MVAPTITASNLNTPLSISPITSGTQISTYLRTIGTISIIRESTTASNSKLILPPLPGSSNTLILTSLFSSRITTKIKDWFYSIILRGPSIGVKDQIKIGLST